MKRPIIALTLVLVLGFVAVNSVFFVDQRQKALVLQLGEPILPVREPGINFKIPFIQNVHYFDNRILNFVIPKTLSLSSDMKPFEVDNYACWRIVDPLEFYRSLRTKDVATDRLYNIVYSLLRAAIGSETLKDIVDTKRTSIMADVLAKANKQAETYGIQIVDIRIKRSDLPNRDAIFQRMHADRKKMANHYRAEGESSSLDIRSNAEKTRDVILAEAQKKSTIIRGEADAQAIQIFADALSASPEFFEFTKSLEVYRKAFKNNSKIIFSAEDPLLKHFQ